MPSVWIDVLVRCLRWLVCNFLNYFPHSPQYLWSSPNFCFVGQSVLSRWGHLCHLLWTRAPPQSRGLGRDLKVHLMSRLLAPNPLKSPSLWNWTFWHNCTVPAFLVSNHMMAVMSQVKKKIQYVYMSVFNGFATKNINNFTARTKISINIIKMQVSILRIKNAPFFVFMSCRKSSAEYFPGAFLCHTVTDFSVDSYLWGWTGKLVCSKFRFEISLYFICIPQYFPTIEIKNDFFLRILFQMPWRDVTWDKYTTVCILQWSFWRVSFSEFYISCTHVLYSHSSLPLAKSSQYIFFFLFFFWQVGCSFGQVYFASAGREWKGGVFLPRSQGSLDSGPG